MDSPPNVWAPASPTKLSPELSRFIVLVALSIFLNYVESARFPSLPPQKTSASPRSSAFSCALSFGLTPSPKRRRGHGDVGRFDVSVNDALLVLRIRPVGDSDCHVDHRLNLL